MEEEQLMKKNLCKEIATHKDFHAIKKPFLRFDEIKQVF